MNAVLVQQTAYIYTYFVKPIFDVVVAVAFVVLYNLGFCIVRLQ